MVTRQGLKTAILMLGALAVAGVASATTVDLTTEGSEGTVGGALFFQWEGQATGTGTIDSFAEIGGNDDVVEGYNTTDNGTFDNGNSDQFNHELLLSDIPTVIIDGLEYREFILDVNQTGADPTLSLDAIQVFTSDIANQTVTSFTGGILDLDGTVAGDGAANLVYNLDGLEDSYILLDYSLNSGSGSGDMLFYVLSDLFNNGDQYVYLYSLFGETENNNDGFEEWAVREGDVQIVVPEPSSLALLGLGLAAAGLRRRFKRS